MRIVVLSVLFTMLTALIAQSAPVPTGDWLELIDVTQLPYLKDGVALQVSGYDRTGGNDDGFSGKYSFIRKEGEKFVIFDEQGPGCIYRFWSANPNKGRVQFFFDGEATPRIDIANWQEMYQGKYEPFMPPVSQTFLGGWISYVPIPFAKSCKVVADEPVQFVQFSWQKFPADRQIKTFTRDMTPEDNAKYQQVKAAWSNIGENPWPKEGRVEKVSKSIAPGGSLALADLDGPGMVREIRVKVDSPDLRIFRKALIEVYTDNFAKPDVWSPIGDFFLDGFGQGISQSLLVGKKDGTYYCYYAMPFDSNALIRIVNQSKANVKIEAEVVWAPMGSMPKDMGYFHAWWHRQNTTKQGELFPILDAKGRGHWCGVSHAMQWTGGLFFLEGDEKASIDGRDSSTYNGTGTEDYFDSGWYFGGTGNAPLYGCGVYDDPGSRCLAFRMQPTTYVPFQQKASIGIEHGPVNDVLADYAGVTYWYAERGATHGFTPVGVDERIPQSPRIPNATEAENVYVESEGVKLASDAEMPFLLSAGRAVVGKSITLKVDAVSAGNHVLYGQLVAMPNGGEVQVSIDGRTVGDPIDARAASMSLVPIAKLADLSFIRKGPHEITFKALGTGGEFMVDCVRVVETGSIEGEQLKILKSSGEDLGEQGLGAAWSNHAQMWFRPKSAGAYFTVELPVEKAGAYTLYAYFTKAADYGIVQVKLDGKPVGQPFDGYNDGVVRSERITLGTVDVTAGAHELTFEVTGKNAKSTSYMVGVDSVQLK